MDKVVFFAPAVREPNGEGIEDPPVREEGKS